MYSKKSSKALQGGSDNFSGLHYPRLPIGWFLTGLLHEKLETDKIFVQMEAILSVTAGISGTVLQNMNIKLYSHFDMVCC